MSTIGGQAQPTIGHLSVRYRGTAAEMNAPALRLRVERLLGSVDLHPAGLPAGAVLIVRHLHGLAPLPAQSQILPSDWTAHLRQQMQTLYAAAARPVSGPVSAGATSVLFTDGAEMLACLTRDLLAGRAWQRWYWQQVLRGVPRAPIPALAALWSARAAQVPAAVAARGKTEALQAIALFSHAEVSAITRALHASFDLPSLVLTTSIPDIPPQQGVSFSSSFAHVPSFVPEPLNALPVVSPWQHLLPATTLPALTPQGHYLLGLTLMLHHAPAFARSTRFAEQAASWLKAELTVPARGKEQMPEQSSSTRVNIDEPAPAPEQAYPGKPSSLPEQASPNMPLPLLPRTPASGQDESSGAAGDAHSIRPRQSRTPDNMQDSMALPGASQPASPPAHEPVLETTQALPLDGLPTGLTGVLYLINLLTWLDLPGGWDDAGTLAEHIGGWGIVEALARGLLAALHNRYVNDPLWSVLASLDGREPGIPVGATLPGQAAFRLPARWLRRYGPADPVWVALVSATRLYLFDEEAGYLIIDEPLSGHLPVEIIVAEVEAYQAQGVNNINWRIAPDSVDKIIPAPDENLSSGGWLSHNTIWWLERVLGFIRYLLTRALGAATSDTQQLAEMLFCKPGRLSVSRTHVDLSMSMDQISIPVRRAGLDHDPGWIPDLAYIVLFHFHEEMP